jgi:hypothetical protein
VREDLVHEFVVSPVARQGKGPSRYMLELLRRVLFVMPLRWLQLSLCKNKWNQNKRCSSCAATRRTWAGFMLPLRSRWLRRSSASISRFCCTSIACASGRPPTPMPTPTPAPTFGGMPPTGPEGGTRCPCLSPITKTAGSLCWRNGYCRTGWACRAGGTAGLNCKGKKGALMP